MKLAFRNFLFLLLLLTSNILNAYITKILSIELKNGKHMILMYDSNFFLNYTVNHPSIGVFNDFYLNNTNILNYNHPQFVFTANLANASLLYGAVLNLAQKMPSKSISFIYEDQLIYSANGQLLTELKKNKEIFNSTNPCVALSLNKPFNASQDFRVEPILKSPHMYSFLFGELTKQIATLNYKNFPNNLIIQSNDPRKEFYLSMKSYVEKNSANILIEEMFFVDQTFVRKSKNFIKDSSLNDLFDKKIKNLERELNDYYKLIKDDFRYEIYLKYNFPAEKDFMKKSILEASQEIGSNLIPDIYEILEKNNKITRQYTISILLDTLYSIFHENAPDVSIIVLEGRLAQNILNSIIELDIAKSIFEHKDPESLLANNLLF